MGANIVALVLGALVLLSGGYVMGLVINEVKTSFRFVSLAGSWFVLVCASLTSSGVSRGVQSIRMRQKKRNLDHIEPTICERRS